ncbi:hypothetical protein Tco_1569102 [Tanacetum coccineum]
MNHSTCSSTSSLVFMVLVLSLWAITPVVPLIPTFITSSLLTCPSNPLVVNNIGICRTPIVTGQMANSVAFVAFGSTWTIMCKLCQYFASCSSVEVVLIVFLEVVIHYFLLFLSLAFSKSADLFVYTFLKLHYWILTLEVSQTSTLITGVSSLIPSSSRIPIIPGHVANLLTIPTLYSTLPIVVQLAPVAQSAAATQSQMPLYSQLEGTGSSVGTAEGSAEARCSSYSSSSSSFSTSSSSLSSSDDSLS